MKRFAAALLLTGAVALGAASAASADAVGDSTGPACTDIVTGAATYNVANPPFNTVTATIEYSAATCTNVQYVLVVSYLSDGKTKVKDQVLKGDGSTAVDPTTGQTVGILSFQINNVSSDDGNVCVATYTTSGSKLYDSSPESGCVTIAADSSGGGGGGTF
jgi:hypothetical protein